MVCAGWRWLQSLPWRKLVLEQALHHYHFWLTLFATVLTKLWQFESIVVKVRWQETINDIVVCQWATSRLQPHFYNTHLEYLRPNKPGEQVCIRVCCGCQYAWSHIGTKPYVFGTMQLECQERCQTCPAFKVNFYTYWRLVQEQRPCSKVPGMFGYCASATLKILVEIPFLYGCSFYHKTCWCACLAIELLINWYNKHNLQPSTQAQSGKHL